MRRLAIALSIMVILAMLVPGLRIVAQPTHIPHEYPPRVERTERTPAASISLLRFYGNVSALTGARQYQDAQTLLEEMKHADIPNELRDIIDFYTTLSQQLITTLNNLETLHDEVSTLFSHDQVGDARQKLNAADKTISGALILVGDAETVTNTLADRLGVFTALGGSQISQAYERQIENLHRIRQLVNELHQLGENLGANPLMEITAEFYRPTFLEVSAAETAYRGVPLTISGQVNSPPDRVERTIKVFLDDTQVAQETVRGQFSVQITPPAQISTGRHLLTVVATPQGHYAGDSKSLPIDILGIPIRAEIQVPLLTIVPKTIRISGKVYHDLTPIEDAKVSVAFKEYTAIVRTSADGNFTTTIEAPFDLLLVGPQDLTVTIEPIEPQYASLEIKRGIIPINPANMGVMLVVLVPLGLLVLNRVRNILPRPREGMVIPQPKLPELSTVSLLPSKYEFTGIKGRILSAYLNGLEVVEQVTTVPIMPHTTLREYISTASPLLPTAIKPFTELTTMAENALYSSHKLDETTAAKAEQLAGTIKEELHSGVA